MLTRPPPMQTAARRSSCKRAIFAEISNVVIRSNIRWRGKAFVASVPTSSFKPQKGQKILKHERRAMAETFIDKYRASNAGRFPTASHVRKEIGGCYYVVRQIVQELEYEYKISPSAKIVQAQKTICPRSSLTDETSVPEPEQILRSNMTKAATSNIGLRPNVKLEALSGVKDAEEIIHLEEKEVNSRKAMEVQKVVCSGSGLKEEPSVSVSETEHELNSYRTGMLKTRAESLATIKLNGHQLEIDDEAIVHSKGRPSLENVQSPSMQAPTVPVKMLENLSNEQILNDDPIIIGAHLHEKNVPSELIEESLRDNSQGTSGSQESNFSKDSTATAKVDFSVTLESEVTERASGSTTGVGESKQSDTILAKQDTRILGVELIDKCESPKPEKLNIDHPRKLGHVESTTRSLWGNLKSFADGIISFWKKK